jgi:hypothetical protein
VVRWGTSVLCKAVCNLSLFDLFSWVSFIYFIFPSFLPFSLSTVYTILSNTMRYSYRPFHMQLKYKK